MEPCIPTDNSLANPSIYTTVLHTLTCILVPVNLFGAYCILFKTPKKMEAVKWLMLSLHCFSFLLDFTISCIAMPYILFPALAGYSIGIEENAFVEAYMAVSLVDGVGVAIGAIFENRYYVLFGRNTWWEKVRKPLFILNHLLIPLFFLPFLFMAPDQDVAFQQISSTFPCAIQPSLGDRKLYILATDFTPFVVSCFLMTCWNLGQIIFYFLTTVVKLRVQKKNSKITSAKTNQMQRKFVIALSLQTFIPVIVLFTPISYICLSVAINYHNQTLNNLTLIIFSLHGILSSTVMISVHEPYRDFTKRLLYRLIRKSPRSRLMSTVQPSVLSVAQKR